MEAVAVATCTLHYSASTTSYFPFFLSFSSSYREKPNADDDDDDQGGKLAIKADGLTLDHGMCSGPKPGCK